MPPDHLSTTFAALADPTRRAILARLSTGKKSVTELARPFDMSLPAVTKHLKVLRRAGLITQGRQAQWRPCRLHGKPLREVADWVAQYRRFWEESFDRLDDYLHDLQAKEKRHGAKPDPDTTLELSRDFKAEPDRVFAVFLDGDALKRIWSAETYTVVEMSMDARIGGGWSLAMRDHASGNLGRCTARYLEIHRPSRIVWQTRWLDGPLAGAPEARVTLEFKAIPGGTRLMLTHQFFPDRQTRDHHRSGWSSGLDRLAALLAERQADRAT